MSEKIVVLITSAENVRVPTGVPLAETVAKAIEGIPDARLMIKTHPNEKKGRYALLEQSEKVTVSQGTGLPELLSSADVVVGMFSTVLIEAAMLGKPVLVYPSGLSNVSIFERLKHGFIAKKLENVQPLLEKILSKDYDVEAYQKHNDWFLSQVVGTE